MSKPRRVFIVDDDRDLAESLAEMLERRGCDVALAHSGEAGLATLRTREFDLVLMDVKLPGMSGVEAFRELRKLRPDARVMMMTGYSIGHALDEALAGGAIGVLHKPFDPARLLSAIETAG